MLPIKMCNQYFYKSKIVKHKNFDYAIVGLHAMQSMAKILKK